MSEETWLAACLIPTSGINGAEQQAPGVSSRSRGRAASPSRRPTHQAQARPGAAIPLTVTVVLRAMDRLVVAVSGSILTRLFGFSPFSFTER